MFSCLTLLGAIARGQINAFFTASGTTEPPGASMRKAVYVDGLQNVLDKLPHSVEALAIRLRRLNRSLRPDRWKVGQDETSPTCPQQHESGRVCLAAEELVLNWANANDRSARAIILRFAGLYGPGRIVRRSILERGEPIPGDPQKFLNLIHIDDAAQAASAALAVGKAEPIFVVSDDRPVTRQEYYSRMASLLDTPSPRFEPPMSGSPDAARDATNKRIANDRIKSGLGIALIYPDITTGLSSCLSPNHQPR